LRAYKNTGSIRVADKIVWNDFEHHDSDDLKGEGQEPEVMRSYKK